MTQASGVITYPGAGGKRRTKGDLGSNAAAHPVRGRPPRRSGDTAARRSVTQRTPPPQIPDADPFAVQIQTNRDDLMTTQQAP